MEWPKISSGGRPGRRKPELRSAALCATCCSSVYSCKSHSKDTQRSLSKGFDRAPMFLHVNHFILAASLCVLFKTFAFAIVTSNTLEASRGVLWRVCPM